MTQAAPRQLTLIRHGALDASLDGCYIGRLDVPLSGYGQQQAQRLAQRLSGQAIDELWCSPALRAQQTAAPIAERLQRSCAIKRELNEVHFGRWEGLTFDQICADDPQRVAQWAQLPDEFCFPDGEAHSDFMQRVEQVRQQILTSAQPHLALVSHGGVIRALLCQLLGWPQRDSLKISLQRGGLAVVELHDQHAVLTGLYNEL